MKGAVISNGQRLSSFWGFDHFNQLTKGNNMLKLFASSVFLMLTLSLSTAFAAVPAHDGIDKQFDAPMFEQLPVMNLQGATVDGVSVSLDASLAPAGYRQVTGSALHQIGSEVVTSADVVGIAGLIIFDKKSLTVSPVLEVGWSRSLN